MDSFFGIGISELFMIALIALVVLGPERLPGTLREVAKFIKTVRSMINELTSQFGDEFKALEDLNPQKLLRELTDDPDKTANALSKTLGTKSTDAKPAAPVTPAPKPAATTTATSAPTATVTSSSTTAPVPVTPKAETVVTPTTSATTTLPAGAMSAEAPSEVNKAVDAPIASEPSILPPPLPAQAVASQTATPQIEVNEAEPLASASIIEGQSPPVQEDPIASKSSESLAEKLMNTALDTLPENSLPEMTSQEISGEDIEDADIVTTEPATTEIANVEATTEELAIENVAAENTVKADEANEDISDADGSEKAAGEVTALPTRSYTKSASINGAHVNGNSKENEA